MNQNVIYWEQRIGFFNAVDAQNQTHVNKPITVADQYVSAQFNSPVKLSAGFLLEKPPLSDSQYAKLGPRQLDELGDDE